MSSYRVPSTKGKIYFYSFIAFVLAIYALDKYLFKLFTSSGSVTDQLQGVEQYSLISAIIGSVLAIVIFYLVYLFAKSMHQYKQFPPPNIEIPFKIKVTPIKQTNYIWPNAFIIFFMLSFYVFNGFHAWYFIRTNVNEIIQPNSLNQALKAQPSASGTPQSGAP
jgi:cellobiose-specific phosphotransferase system component IIC